jgi:excisionase family DNA binding protein
MSDQNNSLAEAFAAIIEPIVKKAVREALSNDRRNGDTADNGKTFLTVKQAAETSGLGASTIRLAIWRRQLRAQRVGRRVLVKRSDLESFLEANPIAMLSDKNP